MPETTENLNISKNCQGYMGLSHWQRVLLGVAGGVLITGGFWGFTRLNGDLRFLVLIPIGFGILSIFYGRYG